MLQSLSLISWPVPVLATLPTLPLSFKMAMCVLLSFPLLEQLRSPQAKESRLVRSMVNRDTNSVGHAPSRPSTSRFPNMEPPRTLMPT